MERRNFMPYFRRGRLSPEKPGIVNTGEIPYIFILENRLWFPCPREICIDTTRSDALAQYRRFSWKFFGKFGKLKKKFSFEKIVIALFGKKIRSDTIYIFTKTIVFELVPLGKRIKIVFHDIRVSSFSLSAIHINGLIMYDSGAHSLGNRKNASFTHSFTIGNGKRFTPEITIIVPITVFTFTHPTMGMDRTHTRSAQLAISCFGSLHNRRYFAKNTESLVLSYDCIKFSSKSGIPSTIELSTDIKKLLDRSCFEFRISNLEWSELVSICIYLFSNCFNCVIRTAFWYSFLLSSQQTFPVTK